jgi:hypothetical protein|nr:MAG TPA: DNA-directed RNA polymerase II subunit [Caudoviricetes sp.]
MIKDSGDRTEFETGAKRDMHAGKGRMDLLPWYGIMEVSKHCEEGALKYGEHNVDKGIPLHSLLDSASRHLAKYMVGMDDEDHLRAACWNLLWALNQRVTHPELDDRFAAKVGEVKKKNYQVLCPNCEATIIKENGQICDGVAWRVGVPNEKVELKCNYCNHSVIVSIKDILDDRFSVKQEKTQKKRPWISVECTNCNKRHPVAPEVWLYDMDEVPASSRILKCPFCNEHWVHKYIGSLDEYANPDDKLVAVKCGGCNAHYKNCVYGLRLQTHNSTP